MQHQKLLRSFPLIPFPVRTSLYLHIASAGLLKSVITLRHTHTHTQTHTLRHIHLDTHTHHYPKRSRNVCRPTFFSFFRREQFLNLMQCFTTLTNRVHTIAHRSVYINLFEVFLFSRSPERPVPLTATLAESRSNQASVAEGERLFTVSDQPHATIELVLRYKDTRTYWPLTSI